MEINLKMLFCLTLSVYFWLKIFKRTIFFFCYKENNMEWVVKCYRQSIDTEAEK